MAFEHSILERDGWFIIYMYGLFTKLSYMLVNNELRHRSLRGAAGNPERTRQRQVTQSGSQSQQSIGFILPSGEAFYRIRCGIQYDT